MVIERSQPSSEAGFELEQEPLDAIDEGLLDLALAARIGGAEERC